MYKIVIDLPHLADGAELHIDGLGTFVKGGDNEVSDEEADAFEIANIRNVPAIAYKYDDEGNVIEGSGEQVGLNQQRTDFIDLFDNLSGIHAELALDLEEDSEEVVKPTEPTAKVLAEPAGITPEDGSGEGDTLTGTTAPENVNTNTSRWGGN